MTVDQHYLIKVYRQLIMVFNFFIITTKVVSLNPVHVIKFHSDLRQVDGYLVVFQFPLPIKMAATI